MTDTPARDALHAKALGIPSDLTPSERNGTRWAIAVALANPDLVLAALIESGWRPTPDDLRAMGGERGTYPTSPDDDSGMCVAWRFPKERADG